MAKQTIVWTAIPNGRVPAGPDAGRLRISIVASPRLTPQAVNEQQLHAFADWVNWPRTLERVRFALNTARRRSNWSRRRRPTRRSGNGCCPRPRRSPASCSAT